MDDPFVDLVEQNTVSASGLTARCVRRCEATPGTEVLVIRV
jgi:hypothetical protein